MGVLCLSLISPFNSILIHSFLTMNMIGHRRTLCNRLARRLLSDSSIISLLSFIILDRSSEWMCERVGERGKLTGWVGGWQKENIKKSDRNITYRKSTQVLSVEKRRVLTSAEHVINPCMSNHSMVVQNSNQAEPTSPSSVFIILTIPSDQTPSPR